MAMERLARTLLGLFEESRNLGGDGLMCFNVICNRVNKEATKMNEAINRVRELHQKRSNNSISYCAACVDYDEENVSPEWPCETIRALDG
jgi:hypothetical protein